MHRWTGRVALVTGASAGIGKATAEELVKAGMKVVGCARRMDKLEALAKELTNSKGTFTPVSCDMREESQILAMFQKIKSDFGRLDVCINNAGMSKPAPFLSGETEQWKAMLDVNVLAVAICTREAYQLMKSAGVDDGHIINISSMSGHRVVPKKDSGFYSSTKFSVRAMTECVRNELRELKTHIRITAISPGRVQTEFAEAASASKEHADALYSSIECLTAKDVADSVLHALSAPPHVQIHDILMRPTEQVL